MAACVNVKLNALRFFVIRFEGLVFAVIMSNLAVMYLVEGFIDFILNHPILTGNLDPENFKEFKLVKKAQLSHNVAKFTFALPTPTSVLGLPIGQHISCKFCCLIFSLFSCFPCHCK